MLRQEVIFGGAGVQRLRDLALKVVRLHAHAVIGIGLCVDGRRAPIIGLVDRVIDAEKCLIGQHALEQLFQIFQLFVADAAQLHAGRGRNQEQRLQTRAGCEMLSASRVCASEDSGMNLLPDAGTVSV